MAIPPANAPVKVEVTLTPDERETAMRNAQRALLVDQAFLSLFPLVAQACDALSRHTLIEDAGGNIVVNKDGLVLAFNAMTEMQRRLAEFAWLIPPAVLTPPLAEPPVDEPVKPSAAKAKASAVRPKPKSQQTTLPKPKGK